MDNPAIAEHRRLGDQDQNDTTISLKTKEGKRESFFTNSALLSEKTDYFAQKLSDPNSDNLIEIRCSELDFDHHVKLLNLLYLPQDSILESLSSVKSAIAVLDLAVEFRCEEVAQCCVRYLEAVPWEDGEEEQILRAAERLGPIAMPILVRLCPVDFVATKSVFLSAIRFAMSIDRPCPPFGDEIKTSAQEQVEYMLGDDEDSPLLAADEEVRSLVRTGLSELCGSFRRHLSSSPLPEASEAEILRTLADLEWACNLAPKMDLMRDFVSDWAEISSEVIEAVDGPRLDSLMWGLKTKLVEIAAKVLDAVGYGTVILSGPCRAKLVKTWLPFIRKIKPILDSKGFGHGMDDDLCQGIEGAIVSLVLSLPSSDQADIFGDWMSGDQVLYPDLSEAFEVWCFRTKSAKRRLMEGLDKVGNATIKL